MNAGEVSHDRENHPRVRSSCSVSDPDRRGGNSGRQEDQGSP